MHHFCLHPSLPPPSSLQPGLALQAPGLNPWQEKGERVTTSGTTTSFSFRATRSLPPPPNPFYDCPICPSSIWTTFGAQDSQDCKQQSQHTTCSLQPCPSTSCSVNIKTSKKHGPRGRLCSHPHPLVQQSCQTGWICLRRTTHEHFSVENSII